jgi:predicted TIM-barrel enzyme
MNMAKWFRVTIATVSWWCQGVIANVLIALMVASSGLILRIQAAHTTEATRLARLSPREIAILAGMSGKHTIHAATDAMARVRWRVLTSLAENVVFRAKYLRTLRKGSFVKS